MPDNIGLPQFGQLSAKDDISLLQSGHFIKAIFFYINCRIAFKAETILIIVNKKYVF
jgi:hypothetical protein